MVSYNSKELNTIGKQRALGIDVGMKYRLFPLKGTHVYRDKFSCCR